MNYWWIGIAIFATFNVGFIVGVFWGAKRRDDYDPVEHQPREMPRIQERQQIFEWWEGLDR